MISTALAYISRRLIARLSLKYRGHYPSLVVFSQDHIAHEIMCFGQYEKFEIQYLLNHFAFDTQKHAFLDIGANIGNHSAAFAPQFKSGYCFEPNPLTYKLLEINSRHSPNLHLYQKGASESQRSVGYEENLSNFGAGKIIKNSPTEKQIQLIRLDDLAELKSESIGFIKIDVEGHELEALRGASGILKSQQPLIAFELLENDFKSNSASLLDFLKSMGYDRFYTETSILPVKKMERLFKRLGLLKRKFGAIQEITPGNYPMVIAESSQSQFKIKI